MLGLLLLNVTIYLFANPRKSKQHKENNKHGKIS
jgi:hypothetical protein